MRTALIFTRIVRLRLSFIFFQFFFFSFFHFSGAPLSRNSFYAASRRSSRGIKCFLNERNADSSKYETWREPRDKMHTSCPSNFKLSRKVAATCFSFFVPTRGENSREQREYFSRDVNCRNGWNSSRNFQSFEIPSPRNCQKKSRSCSIVLQRATLSMNSETFFDNLIFR